MPKFGAVKLLKQVKTGNGWQHAPALFDSEGRVRRDHVIVQGRDEIHEEGSYFLEWWDAGKRRREPGGPDAFIAAEKARRKQAERAAIHSGIVTPANDNKNGKTSLKTALDKYEEYVRFHRSLRTYRTYTLTTVTGSSNTALGTGIGATLTTGSSNILIGDGVDVPSASTSNYLNIGGAITGSLTRSSMPAGAPSTRCRVRTASRCRRSRRFAMPRASTPRSRTR